MNGPVYTTGLHAELLAELGEIRRCAPLRIYTWDLSITSATDDGVTYGAAGATTDLRRAIKDLGGSLRLASAKLKAIGVVRAVELDPIGTASYTYGSILARASRDPDSGHVTWSM